MKKLITTLVAIATILCSTANAQNYTKVGNTYKVEKVAKQSSSRQTGFNWEDSKGNTYPILMGPSGACYIKRVSKKTGKEYKQYLGKEVSQSICKQLGVQYKPSK